MRQLLESRRTSSRTGGVNLVRASDLLFSCLEALISGGVRARGEFQVTDALQGMVDRGAVLGTFPVMERFDCRTQEALLETNRHLLEGTPVPAHAADSVLVPPVTSMRPPTLHNQWWDPTFPLAPARGKKVCRRQQHHRREAVAENAILRILSLVSMPLFAAARVV